VQGRASAVARAPILASSSRVVLCGRSGWVQFKIRARKKRDAGRRHSERQGHEAPATTPNYTRHRPKTACNTMHRRSSVLSCLILALIALISAPPWVSAVPSRSHGRVSLPLFPLPHPIPKRPVRDKNNGRWGWCGRFYDAVIQRLPRRVGKEDECSADSETSQSQTRKQSSFGPPSNTRARYDEDIVLRFNISSSDEAKALAEATAVLFLDIWESNDEWVDIRLAKDVVRCSHFPYHNQTLTRI
jgi:hypothetical protein